MATPDTDTRTFTVNADTKFGRIFLAQFLQAEADEAGRLAGNHEAEARRQMRAAEAYATAAHLLRKRWSA